jgi:hypothetical protein
VQWWLFCDEEVPSVFRLEAPTWWPCTFSSLSKSPDLTISTSLQSGNIFLSLAEVHHIRCYKLSTTMPRATRETEIYRKDAKLNHNLLTPAEREKLLEVQIQPVKPLQC